MNTKEATETKRNSWRGENKKKDDKEGYARVLKMKSKKNLYKIKA